MIKINSGMPDHFLPLRWQPLFEKEEKTAKTHARIGKIHSEWVEEFNTKLYYFLYDYSVNNFSFTRIHYLPSNYQTIYKQLEKGDQFEVEYWADNPRRAIINLYRPLQ